jgi:lactoylglutathione lyase
MPLGAFSVSLAVKDLEVSVAFYKKLGFEVIAGHEEQNWLILRSGSTTLGLFQGMFEKNCLTFNPGWDYACNLMPEFEDVRSIQKRLKDAGDIEFTEEADESTTGPAYFSIVDPDGNPILFDQHV